MNAPIQTTRPWFILSAGAILVVTGIAKVWASFGNSKLLAVSDPICGVPLGTVLLVVGLAEILVASVCFLGKRPLTATVLVAWLATTFLLYRCGLRWIGWHKPCSCLGNLTDALHISPQTADNIMKVVLAYLLIGSYGLLFWHWRQARPQSDGGPRHQDLPRR